MKRPLSVTVISVVFILSGLVGIFYHATDLIDLFSKKEVAWVFAVRLLAVVGGVATLRGNSWARWALIAWIGYHLVISFYHSAEQIIAHAVVAILTIVLLFNKKANSFFRQR